MSARETLQKTKDRLNRAFDENPILFIGVSAAALQATAKLLSARTEAENAKVWRREVDRRDRKDRAKLHR